ncbi:uncharacterized protein LOC125238689 [Leguminivora glycinivorella]|uniref:uncharacterized protein LOC125238689 n=1 Tax=Leguminivora glycinivorella TaxID=1035111 RepID=UPI00200F6829|nr:uncharacterized protein LOC125238689 [Leguminivora glycinivorella]
MPKRKKDDTKKIDKYLRKIQRLKEKHRRREHRSRSPSYIEPDDSDANYHSDADTIPSKRGEQQPEMDVNQAEGVQQENDMPTEVDMAEVTLDSDTLQALGKPLKEKLKYGPNINGDLSKLWSPILKNGLGDYKERQHLLEKYMVPSNCVLLQAPKLNPEILATISEKQKNRDKKIGEEQQQLGHGITALNRALSLLATNTGDRATIINTLSEASQILSDLHHNQTQSRKKLITPILDKKFLDLIKDAERDEYLYGSDLSDKIKALKYAQKVHIR